MPQEYVEVAELAALLPLADEKVIVLAPAKQSAWLPVAHPGIGVVAFGHTQLGTMRKLMSRKEYVSRSGLQTLSKHRPGKLVGRHTARFMRYLGITHVIVSKHSIDTEFSQAVLHGEYVQLLGKTKEFLVFRLSLQ